MYSLELTDWGYCNIFSPLLFLVVALMLIFVFLCPEGQSRRYNERLSVYVIILQLCFVIFCCIVSGVHMQGKCRSHAFIIWTVLHRFHWAFFCFIMTSSFSHVASAKLKFICWKDSGTLCNNWLYQGFCCISLHCKHFYLFVHCMSLASMKRQQQ